MAHPPDRKMLELLVCPLTKGPLKLVPDSDDEHVSWLVSPSASLRFPVRDGVPILVEAEAEPLDDTPAPAKI